MTTLRMLLAASLAVAASSTALAQGASGRYAGRPLVDVLQDLGQRGLRIVFSTTLVPPALRVADEPPGPSPREMLDQVLRPHGLQARVGPRGVLIIARAPVRPEQPAAPRPSPASGTVRGRVVDADTEEPLAGALVVARQPERRVTTDRDGRFEITGLEPRLQPLYVSLVGYGLARPDVDASGDGTAELVVPLAAGAGAYTEQLTVRATTTASAATGPAEFTIRGAELHDLRGVLADDPIRAMQTMPGAATGDDFRSEFSVRGSDFRHVGITIDGIVAPWLVHAVRAVEDTGTVAMVNGDVLDEVTLVSGATAQTFGNRTGAWIHTMVREGSRDAFRVGGTLSGTGAAIVTEGPVGRARRGSWLFSVRQSYIDWLIRQLDTQDQTAFGFTDAQGKLVFDLSPRHQLQLLVLAGRSQLDERDDGPAVNGVRLGRSSTGFVSGTWRAALGPSVILTQRSALSGLRYRNTNDFDQELAKGHEWAWTYRGDVTLSPGPSWMLDIGGAFDREWVSDRRQQYAAPGAAVSPSLRSLTALERRRWRQGSYVRGRARPAADVSVDAGLRVDRDASALQTVTSPWALATWEATSRWSFAAGTGRAHQWPELTQMQVALADQVRAETARYADVSATYAVTPAVDLQARAYVRTERDVLTQDVSMPRLRNGMPFTPVATGLWRNGLDVSARGVELVLRRRAAAGPAGWVSYAYGRTRSRETETGESYWADFDQRHQLNLHASYRLGSRTSASARLRVGSNMPVLGYFAEQNDRLTLAPTRNDLRLPTYSRLDLRMNRTYDFASRRLTLFVEVLNVLNRENVGRTDGSIRASGAVTGFVETLFPLLPSAGLRIEF